MGELTSFEFGVANGRANDGVVLQGGGGGERGEQGLRPARLVPAMKWPSGRRKQLASSFSILPSCFFRFFFIVPFSLSEITLEPNWTRRTFSSFPFFFS